MKTIYVLFISFLIASSFIIDQTFLKSALSAEAAKIAGGVSGKTEAQTAVKEIPEEPLTITHHSIHLRDQTLNYRATAGYMPICQHAFILPERSDLDPGPYIAN